MPIFSQGLSFRLPIEAEGEHREDKLAKGLLHTTDGTRSDKQGLAGGQGSGIAAQDGNRPPSSKKTYRALLGLYICCCCSYYSLFLLLSY